MDEDFWAARVQSAKHISAVQAARLCNSDSQNTDDGEDDFRAWFPCPFCYVEIEVPVLCSHFQDEHCFDLKNAVCPICAATLGKDAIRHFTVQHAHSVKHRRKSRKSGLWRNASAVICKDFRELTSFLGSNSVSSCPGRWDPVPDLLLSPFLCTTPLSESKENKLDETSGSSGSTTDIKRCISSMSDPPKQQDNERMKRASFFQELILSTIF